MSCGVCCEPYKAAYEPQYLRAGRAKTIPSELDMGEQQGQNVMRRKLVIIGDGACGKTSLLSVFTLGYFPTVRLL